MMITLMFHATAKPDKVEALCAMALKAMGLDAERALDFRDGCDFLGDRKVRIAVRYAIPTRPLTYGMAVMGLYVAWLLCKERFHRSDPLPP